MCILYLGLLRLSGYFASVHLIILEVLVCSAYTFIMHILL